MTQETLQLQPQTVTESHFGQLGTPGPEENDTFELDFCLWHVLTDSCQDIYDNCIALEADRNKGNEIWGCVQLFPMQGSRQLLEVVNKVLCK